LGVTWDEARAKQTIQLTEIDSGSAAESAGLQPGDRLVAFDGARIATADDLREAVLAAGDPATAVVERNGQKSPRSLTVHLHGSPEPTGISCRADEAEPGCVIVRHVVSGSPASRAGVRVNDRIQKVARSTFGSLQEFGALLADQHGPFEIQIERDGDLKVLQVAPIRRQTGRKILLSSPR
jgi:S1-C subfamily serine protease